MLQSKIVRNGNQVHPLKTRMIVACTNRSRHEVVTDDSIEALMQRFYYQQLISWNTYTFKDYHTALSLEAPSYEEDSKMLVREAYINTVSFICSRASLEPAPGRPKYIIPPRMAYKTYMSAIKNGGFEFLNGTDYLDYMYSVAVDRFNTEIENIKISIQLNDMILDCKNMLDFMQLKKIDDPSIAPIIESYLRDLNDMFEVVSVYKATTTNAKLLADTTNILTSTMSTVWGYYILVVSESKAESKIYDKLLACGEPRFSHLRKIFDKWKAK